MINLNFDESRIYTQVSRALPQLLALSHRFLPMSFDRVIVAKKQTQEYWVYLQTGDKPSLAIIRQNADLAAVGTVVIENILTTETWELYAISRDDIWGYVELTDKQP
jgi:hypothetical protein